MKKGYIIFQTVLVIFLMFLCCSLVINSSKTISAKKYKKFTVKVGQTKKIKVKGSSSKTEWSSDDYRIARVSIKGKYTALTGCTVGTTKIRATTKGKTKVCKVVVKKSAGNVTEEKAVSMLEKCFKGYIFLLESDGTVHYKGKDYWVYALQRRVDNHLTTDTRCVISIDGTVFAEGDYSYNSNKIILY